MGVLKQRALQALFWNPVGAKLVPHIAHLERCFDTVVRGFSLMPATNGERWLPTLLESAPVVVDVGFHAGTWTRELLAIRPNATAYGFDPSRFARASYDSHFGSDRRVHFHNVALAGAPGRMTLYDYGNMCNSLTTRRELPNEVPTTYEVSVTTLDEFCTSNQVGRIGLLKVDAEGYDLDVLQGAQGLLDNQHIDIFMFEFASGWAGTRRYLWEAVEYFGARPYRLFHLCNGFLRPMRYSIGIDSCTTLQSMYVGVSEQRLEQGGIEIRDYKF